VRHGSASEGLLAQVVMNEVGQLSHLDILGLAIAQVGDQLVEGKLEPVALFQLFPEHNRVDRNHAEVVEETRPAGDFAEILTAGKVAHDADEVVRDRLRRLFGHDASDGPVVQATTRLPSRAVSTRRGSGPPGSPCPNTATSRVPVPSTIPRTRTDGRSSD